ncbi:MAG: AbrB/MazE/SpoVT family DNA-binding domain-containing protein [Firmicutes bacterium]|nr:AbrB/MazE/SpoVT family DNA-binding domain-containing protein [Bacillota bacterium]
MKATGIVRRIDDLGRVVIPKEIRRTLRIRENDPLEIFTDRNGEIIFKKYAPMGDLSDYAQEYADSLSESTGNITAIIDEDEIIAINGAPKKSLLGKVVTESVRNLLAAKQPYLSNEEQEDFPVEGFSSRSQVLVPIIHEGEIIGGVVMLSKTKKQSELEVKLCSTAANFLAKQLG